MLAPSSEVVDQHLVRLFVGQGIEFSDVDVLRYRLGKEVGAAVEAVRLIWSCAPQVSWNRIDIPRSRSGYSSLP